MSQLALLGRAEHLEAIDRAIESVRQGGVVLLSIVGTAGSGRTTLLDEVESRSRAAGFDARRATLFPASVTNPGELAETLGISLDSPPGSPTAFLIADAQYADGTSLATLQGLIAGATTGVLVVGAQAEPTGYELLSYQRLIDTAARTGSFRQLTLDPLTLEDVAPIAANDDLARILVERSGGLAQDLTDFIEQWTAAGTLSWEQGKLVATGPPPEPVDVWSRVSALDRSARKLVEAASLAAAPISLQLASALLETSADEMLELGEKLAAEGLLRESAEGFLPVNATAAQRVADRIGEVRRARAFGELADTSASLGLEGRRPAIVGGYYLEAARWEDAKRLLAEAGLAAANRGALGEALPMVQGALQACRESGSQDSQLEGLLRLARAQCYQAAVWLDLALEDADLAAQLLAGERKVDALGYAAAVALDLQRTQESERYASAGLSEAHAIGEPAKHGSLLTLHARIINRLGFAVEADAEYEKGLEIVRRHGTAMQLHWAHVNGAWISFDRGQARQAEAQFAEVTDEAERLGGLPWRSDREGQWSRALFETGMVSEALTARRRAIEGADTSGLPLTHTPSMSLAEGALRVRRYEEALVAADDMLAIVLQKNLGWENAARYLRARALHGMGRPDEAAEELRRALDATPRSIDGWRWRLKIRVLQMMIDADRGEPWPREEALTLTDELLHNKWYLTAAELLTGRAEHEKDPLSAEDAAALATQLGVPMVAAEAVRVGDLWSKPAGAAVVAAIKRMADHVPEDWRDAWSELPAVSPGLAAADVTDEAYEAAIAELEGDLEESLSAAGFGSVDTLLSPAQRRAGGLRRRPRRRPVWQLAAAGLGGAAVLAVGGFLAVTLFTSDTNTTTTTAETTTTTATTTTTVQLPEVWEVELGAPEKVDRVVGQWSFRADFGADNQIGLPGVSSRPAMESIDGYYWRFSATDQVRSSPAIRGETVIFGSDDGNLYGIVTSSGPPALWTEPTQDAIVAAPVLAEVRVPGATPGAVDTEIRVFFGSRDGRLRSRDALQPNASVFSFPDNDQPPMDGIVAAPLVMDNVVFFGTEAGQVWAVDAGTLQPVWEGLFFDAGSTVTVAPVGADGSVYVGTQAGILWKIDAATGSGELCYDAGSSITSDLVVSGGVIYIPVRDAQLIDARRVGSCGAAPSIALDAPAESPPAVAGDILYTGNGRFLEARDLSLTQTVWRFPGDDVVGGLGGAVRWPVVVQGAVYFTSDDGWVYAVDLDGQELWRYQMGFPSVTSPAPGTAVVFVADRNGTLHAIGCADPPDCGAGDS